MLSSQPFREEAFVSGKNIKNVAVILKRGDTDSIGSREMVLECNTIIFDFCF